MGTWHLAPAISTEPMKSISDIVGKARRVIDLQTIFKDQLDSRGLSAKQAAALAECADLTNGILKDLVRTTNVVTDDPAVTRAVSRRRRGLWRVGRGGPD